MRAPSEEVMIASRVTAAQSSGFEDGRPRPRGLSRPTSAQQVADHIRRMIFENRLPAGERVPQDEIAADLGVSRVPVREAVIALDHEGWVTTEPHRGAFVNGLDENSTRDHYELLGRLYGFTARRAAERGSPDGLTALTQLHRMLQGATDPHEFTELNMDFLRQLMALAGSRRISAVARVMGISIVPGDFFAEVPGAMRLHKRGLRNVMRALKAGDGETAEREFVDTLQKEADNVVSLLASRGLLGAATD
jgi:DNA-binding GntR family transcriptional regulator